MVSNPLPVFPLETVLLPGALLPLRIFEPRYQTLLHDIADDLEFGSVLIERGSEVGGGESRMELGTVGQIISLTRATNHTEIVIVGTQRFTVDDWLDDAPYPRANVSIIEEPPSQADDWVLVEAIRNQWHELNQHRALATLNTLVPLDDLAEDPALFSFQAAALAPIGPLDRYRIVEAQTPADRLRTLLEMLHDQVADMQKARQLE